MFANKKIVCCDSGFNDIEVGLVCGSEFRELESHQYHPDGPVKGICDAAGVVERLCKEHEPNLVVVDADGIGGALADLLRDKGLHVRSI